MLQTDFKSALEQLVEMKEGIGAVQKRLDSRWEGVLSVVPVMFYQNKGAFHVFLCQYLSLATLQTDCVQYGTQK